MTVINNDTYNPLIIDTLSMNNNNKITTSIETITESNTGFLYGLVLMFLFFTSL